MIKKKINRFLALSLTAMMIVTSVPITTVASEETEVSTESETQSKEEEENNDDAEGNGDEVNAEESKEDNSSSEGRQETSSNDDNSGEESSTESADVSSGEVESVVDTVTDSETDITDDVVDNTNTEEVNTTEIGVEETTETESSTEQTTESLTEVETETESTTEIEQTTESLTDVETETETESTTEVETETIEEETTTEELELEFEYTYKDNDQHTKHCVNDESVEDVTEDCAYPAEANKDGDFICELCGNVKEDKQTESSEVTFKVTFKEGDEVVKEQEITANIDDEVKLELPDGYQTGDDLSVIVKAEQEDIIINVTKIEKEPVEFDVLDGITDDYVLADGGDLTFRIDADIDTFQRLLVDGEEVSSEQYSVKSGSTIITIKESFMKTLDAGQHKVRSEFDEGFAEVKFNIVERTEYLIKFFALREKESQEKSDGEDEPVNALKESTSEMVDASNNATVEETSSKDKYEYEEVFSIMTTDGKIDYFPSVMIYEFATPKGIWVVGEDGDTEVNKDTVFEKDTCIYMTYDFIEEQEDDGEFDVSFWILVDINDADLTDEVKEAVFENGDENNNDGLPHYIYTKLETIRTVNGKVERFPKITAKVPEWAGNWCLKNDDGEYSEKINEEYLFTEDTDVWAEYIMPAVDYELGDGDVLLDDAYGTAVWNESTGVLKIYAVKVATSNYPWSSIVENVREAYAIGDITKFKSCYCLFNGMSNMIKVDVSQLDTTSITEMTSMFSGCRNLTEIVGLENIDTSSVKNMYSMFYNCNNITEINVSGFNTNCVINMEKMFSRCFRLGTIDVSGFNTSQVVTMREMFSGCSEISNLDVKSWNVGSVTNMYYMFNSTSATHKLKELNVSNWDVHSLEDACGMFWGLGSVEIIDVSRWNTESLEHAEYMFSYCKSLKQVDLSNWNLNAIDTTPNFRGFENMFDGCYSLENIKLFSTDNLRFTVSFNRLLFGCSSLKSIDLSNIDFKRIENVNQMLIGCSSLEHIELPYNSTITRSVTNLQLPAKEGHTWYDLTTDEVITDGLYQVQSVSHSAELRGPREWTIDGTTYTEDNADNIWYADTYYHDAAGNENEFPMDIINFSNITILTPSRRDSSTQKLEDSEFYAKQSLKSTVFIDDGVYGLHALCFIGRDDSGANFEYSNSTGLLSNVNYITKIIGGKDLIDAAGFVGFAIPIWQSEGRTLDVSKFRPDNLTYFESAFRGRGDCDAIIGLSGLNVSKIGTGAYDHNTFFFGGDFSDVFSECENITSLDLTGWDVSSANELDGMFNYCQNLRTVYGIENFDVSNATDLSSMFYNCSSIESLNIGSWDTSNVTDFEAMFENCNSLTSLDVSSWDTSKAETMQQMFYDCSSLTSLDVSSWNTSNVKNMHYLFNTCSALTSLDVSSWDTSNVTDMTSMFCNCSSITSINVSGFNTNNVKGMNYMFFNCSGLTTIDLSSFSTDSLTVAVGILDGCTKLTKIKTPTSTKALGLTLPRTSQGYWHDEEDDVDITTNKYNLQSTSHTLTFHYSVKSKVPASITAEVSTPIIIDEKEEVPTDNITVKVTYDVVYTDDSTDTLEEEITPPNANLAITPSPVTYGTTEITLTYTEDGESVQTTLPVTVNCLHENTTTLTITEATYFNAGEEQDICDQCGDVTATRTVNKLIDTTAPEIEIKVADNSWKSFLNTITFGLAYKDRQEAKITIKDDESQIIEASYWLLKFTDRQAKDGVQLAVSGQVDGDWSQYYNAKLLVNGVEKSRTDMIFIGSVTADGTRKTQTRTINLADINEYIVVVRAVDSQGNYAWASSNGVIVDSQKPAVFWTYIFNGVEVWVDMGVDTTISRDDYDYKCVGAISNGQWKVAVEDETLRKIVVSKDGTEIESIDIKSGGDGKDDTTIMNNVFRKDYSSNGYGMYKVVATDSAGNTTTSTFKYYENGHRYGAQTVEWSEDNSEVTFKRVCADSSKHILTETVSTYTEITAPTCENKGEGTYTATPTKAGLTSVTKTVDVDATGHDWNTPTYTWSVDNTTVDASTECKNDATHTVSEKANVEHKITLAPTCDTDGEEALTAEFTKEPFTTQTKNSTKIDKLGHNYGDLTVKTEPKLDGTKAVLEHICDRCDKSEAFDEVSRVVTSVEIVPDRFNVYDGEKPDIRDIESIKITLEVTFNDTDSTTKSFTFETTIDNIADNGDVDIDNDGTPDINVDIEDKIPVDGDTVDVTVKIPTDGTDKTDIKQIPVDVIEHIFSNEWTIDKQPTCTEDGEKSHHCTDEGYEELKSDVTVIPALGHDYESEITTKPELDGTVAVKTYTCKRCGDKKTTTETVRVVKDVVIEPNKVELLEDNKPDKDDIPNINVTITVTFDDGTEEDFEFNIDPSDADNNGDIDVDGDGDVDANIDIDYTEPIADGDEIKITIKIPEDGTTDVIEEKLPIEIVEHKFSTEWIVDKAPTCTEEGIESRHCLDAGYEDLKIDERVIPALGHDWATYTISDLTLEDYTAKVVKTYECSRCDATQTTTEINRTIIKIDIEPNPIEKIEGQPIKEEDIDKIKITVEVEFDDGTKEDIIIETTPDKDEVEIDIPDGTDGLPIGNNEINISITVPKDEGEEIVVPVKVTVVKKKKPSNNTANNSFNSDNNNNRSNGVNVYRMVDVHIAGLLVGQTGCSVTVNSPKKSYDVSDDGYYRISSIAVGETKINYYINNQKEEVASITLTTDYSGRIYDIRVTKVTEGFNIELLTDKDTTNRLIVHLTTDAFMETRSELYKVETLPEDGIINEEALDNPRVFVGDASADEMSRFNNQYFTEIDKSYDHTVDVGKSQFSVLKLWENPFTGSVQLGEPITIEEDIVKYFTVNLSGNADVVIKGEKRHTVNSLSDVAVDSDEMHKNYVSVSDRSMLSQKFVDTVNISNIEKIKNSDTIFDKENPAIYIIIVFVMLAIILVTAFVKRSNNSDEEQ